MAKKELKVSANSPVWNTKLFIQYSIHTNSCRVKYMNQLNHIYLHQLPHTVQVVLQCLGASLFCVSVCSHCTCASINGL